MWCRSGSEWDFKMCATGIQIKKKITEFEFLFAEPDLQFQPILDAMAKFEKSP